MLSKRTAYDDLELTPDEVAYKKEQEILRQQEEESEKKFQKVVKQVEKILRKGQVFSIKRYMQDEDISQDEIFDVLTNLMQEKGLSIRSDSADSFFLDSTYRLLDGASINFPTNHLKIGIIGGLYIGTIYTQQQLIDEAYRNFARVGVDMVLCTGDFTAGSVRYRNSKTASYSREEEIYLKNPDAVVDLIVKHFPKIPQVKTYVISGDYDLSYRLCDDPNYNILQKISLLRDDIFYGGDRQLPITIGSDPDDALKVLMRHSSSTRMGIAYAGSYREQKFMNSFDDYNRPQMIILGHTDRQDNYQYKEKASHIINAPTLATRQSWFGDKDLPVSLGYTIWDCDVLPFKYGVVKKQDVLGVIPEKKLEKFFTKKSRHDEYLVPKKRLFSIIGEPEGSILGSDEDFAQVRQYYETKLLQDALTPKDEAEYKYALQLQRLRTVVQGARHFINIMQESYDGRYTDPLGFNWWRLKETISL